MAISPYEGVGNDSIMLKAQRRQQQEQSEMAMWAMMFQQMMNQVNAGQQNQYNIQQLQEQGRQNIMALRESNALGMQRDTHQHELGMKQQAFAYGLARVAQDDLMQIQQAEKLSALLVEGIGGPDLGADPDYERTIGGLQGEIKGYIRAGANAFTLPITKHLQDDSARQMQEGVQKTMGPTGMSDVEMGRQFITMGSSAAKRLEAHTTAEQTGAKISQDFTNHLTQKYGINVLDLPSQTIDDELTLFVTNTKQLAPYAQVLAYSKQAGTGDLPENTGKAVNGLINNAGGPLGLSFFRGFLGGVADDLKSNPTLTSDVTRGHGEAVEALKGRADWVQSFLQADDNPSVLRGEAQFWSETNSQGQDGRAVNLAPARAIAMSFLQSPQGRQSFEQAAKESASQRGITLDETDMAQMYQKVTKAGALADGTFGSLLAQSAQQSAQAVEIKGENLSLKFREEVAARYGRQRKLKAALNAQQTYERMIASKSNSIPKSALEQNKMRLDALWKDLGADPNNPQSFQSLATNLPEEVNALQHQMFTNLYEYTQKQKDEQQKLLTTQMGKMAGQQYNPQAQGQAPTPQAPRPDQGPMPSPGSSVPTVNLNFGGQGSPNPQQAPQMGMPGMGQLPERYAPLVQPPQPQGPQPLPPENGVLN